MERLIKLQENIYERICKAKTNFKKSPKERVTRPYVEIRLSSLEELWQQFEKNHDSLILETELEELRVSTYGSANVFDKCEECYLEYKLSLITSLEAFKSGDNSCNPERSIASSSQLKLPKIVIPIFSGSYTEWITFRDLFTSLVHNSTNLDNVQKMHYLKGYLAGEAEQLVRQISISDQNYERAWTLLTDRYNNKKYLTNNILHRLFGQRSATQETAQHLKDLVDTTCDCLSGLSKLGVNVSDWDTIVIYILLMKLDTETKRQWEFSRNNNSSEILSTFKEFKEFLINRSRALEALEVNRNTVSNVKSLSNPKVFHVFNVNNCSFCSDVHALNVCKMFSNETVEARRNFVHDQQLCYSCLGSSHIARFCKRNVKCRRCKKRHHTLLHQESSTLPTTMPRNQENCGIRKGTLNTSITPSSGMVACHARIELQDEASLKDNSHNVSVKNREDMATGVNRIRDKLSTKKKITPGEVTRTTSKNDAIKKNEMYSRSPQERSRNIAWLEGRRKWSGEYLRRSFQTNKWKSGIPPFCFGCNMAG